MNMKKQNPKLKILLAIGGWDVKEWSDIVPFPSKRSVLVQSSIQFCKSYGFDGIDLDWEFPKSSSERTLFTNLVKEFRLAIDQNSMILTAAMSASPTAGINYYDIASVHPYLDYINLMTYDYHSGSWEFPPAPAKVYAPIKDCQANNFDITASVDHYLSYGVPSSKIILGLSNYGRTFPFGSNSGSTLNSPSSSSVIPGECTKDGAFLSYYEIRKLVQSSYTEEKATLLSAYATYSTSNTLMFVGFDTPNTHRLKTCWARYKKLGGIMTWTADLDDDEFLSRNLKLQLDTRQCTDFLIPKCLLK
jgi:chitinase